MASYSRCLRKAFSRVFPHAEIRIVFCQFKSGDLSGVFVLLVRRLSLVPFYLLHSTRAILFVHMSLVLQTTCSAYCHSKIDTMSIDLPPFMTTGRMSSALFLSFLVYHRYIIPLWSYYFLISKFNHIRVSKVRKDTLNKIYCLCCLLGKLIDNFIFPINSSIHPLLLHLPWLSGIFLSMILLYPEKYV